MKPCSQLCTEQSGAGVISVIALIYIFIRWLSNNRFCELQCWRREYLLQRNIITIMQGNTVFLCIFHPNRWWHFSKVVIKYRKWVIYEVNIIERIYKTRRSLQKAGSSQAIKAEWSPVLRNRLLLLWPLSFGRSTFLCFFTCCLTRCRWRIKRWGLTKPQRRSMSFWVSTIRKHPNKE